MKICVNCVLPETFPGIRFDTDGVCSHCRSYEKKKAHGAADKTRYEKKFRELLETVRRAAGADGAGYHAVMAYSGGKDSSYTLKVLKERYGLNVLALTVNHGFMSPQALRNMRSVTDALSIDHWMISPGQDPLRRAFARSIAEHRYPMKALERASSICNTCMNLVKSLVLKAAIEMEIPLIAYGWSPGQAPVQSSVMKYNPSLVRQTQGLARAHFEWVAGEVFAPYLLRDRHFRMLDAALERYGGQFLYNVHPLAFLEYDEEAIVREIRTLGWEPPRDTDPNSTNCLLNALANQVHLETYGFHPYAFEIAGLVREGHMSRAEGMKKLAEPPNVEIVRSAKSKLGIA